MKALISSAVLAGLLAAGSGLAVGGLAGLIWIGCGYLAFVAALARLTLGTGEVRHAAERVNERPAPHQTHYVKCVAHVRSALVDGRYFGNVVAPGLLTLARDRAAQHRGRAVPDGELATALGPRAWAMLSAAGERDRDHPPTEAELGHLFNALEGL